MRPVLLAGFLAATFSAAAAPAPITVSAGWTRPTPAGMTAAGYLTIANRGSASVRLVGAASPIAGQVSLHESRQVGTVATMRPVPFVVIPPRGRVVFAPGGLHLMLSGLMRPLRPGDGAPLVLKFAGAPPVRVSLTVRAGPPAMPGMRM